MSSPEQRRDNADQLQDRLRGSSSQRSERAALRAELSDLDQGRKSLPQLNALVARLIRLMED